MSWLLVQFKQAAWKSAYRQNDDARAGVNATRLCTRTCMRWVVALSLLLLLFVVAIVPCFGQDSNAATVTVYRPKRTYGKVIRPSIYCDGIELERLRNGSFFVVSLPLGKHMISSGRSEVGQLVDLQPGKRYFLRFGFKRWVTGFVGVQPVTLSVVSEEKARTEMDGLNVNEK